MHPLSIKTQAAVVSCNVSYKKNIDAETLVDVLSGLVPVTPWQAHLDTFFNELPKEYILGVMQENDISLGTLAAVYNSLHPVFQGKNFRELLHENG
jgi:hypothetical protein